MDWVIGTTDPRSVMRGNFYLKHATSISPIKPEKQSKYLSNLEGGGRAHTHTHTVETHSNQLGGNPTSHIQGHGPVSVLLKCIVPFSVLRSNHSSEISWRRLLYTIQSSWIRDYVTEGRKEGCMFKVFIQGPWPHTGENGLCNTPYRVLRSGSLSLEVKGHQHTRHCGSNLPNRNIKASLTQ